MVKDIYPGKESSDPGNLTEVGGTLYFSADDGVHGMELWKSDGSDLTTVMVMDIYDGLDGSAPRSFNDYDGKTHLRGG